MNMINIMVITIIALLTLKMFDSNDKSSISICTSFLVVYHNYNNVNGVILLNVLRVLFFLHNALSRCSVL